MSDGFDLPPLGHNQPPEDEQDPFERAEALVENTNRWIKERPDIADEEQAGACQLMIDQLRKVEARIKAHKKAASEPFELALEAIAIQHRVPLKSITICLDTLEAKARAWLVLKRERAIAESARLAREAEAARQQAERAMTEAVTNPTVQAELAASDAIELAERLGEDADRAPGRARIKGEYAAKAMSLRETWRAEPIKGEETKAIRSYAKHPHVLAAALKAATKVASDEAKLVKREDAAPPGWRFFKTEKAV